MNKNHNIILAYITKHPLQSSNEIHNGIHSHIGYATVKRILKILKEKHLITTKGNGRATKYKISSSYNILRKIDIEDYFQTQIDERKITNQYNFELIPNLLTQVDLFTKNELLQLNNLQKNFTENIESLNKYQYQKELERLAIDLSWKSSQIEGNTYSLLETEKLLKEKITAVGKHRDEATMLLNHKDAIDFILENPDYLHPLEVRKIEDIHSILIKELDVDKNIRIRRVGITGTNYRPLDNEYQIREALYQMCNLVNSKTNIFEKSLLLLILLSYIQAFNDGNKRTARIVSNACLIQNKYCPISFRTVDSIEYKKAMLIFYEQNNISAFKKIFINQFEFAVNTYF